MSCDAVLIKVSAGSPGNSGPGIALPSCSKSSLWGQAFRPLCWSYVEHQLLQDEGLTLSKSLSSVEMVPEEADS